MHRSKLSSSLHMMKYTNTQQWPIQKLLKYFSFTTVWGVPQRITDEFAQRIWKYLVSRGTYGNIWRCPETSGNHLPSPGHGNIRKYSDTHVLRKFTKIYFEISHTIMWITNKLSCMPYPLNFAYKAYFFLASPTTCYCGNENGRFCKQPYIVFM